MDVAIFGAGVAGLMAAITLRSAGHQPRVFERARENQEAGMGFILVPECIQALQSYGIDFEGVPLERFRFRDSAGNILHEENMRAGSRSVRRRDVVAALARSLSKDALLRFDSELIDFEFDERGFVKMARACLAGRTIEVNADLYVSADGIGSRGRQSLFPGWPLPQAQTPEVVGLVRSPETVRWAANNFNKFHALEGGIAVGVLPVDAEHMVWFLQFDSRRFPPPPEGAKIRRDFVHAIVGRWAEPIPFLLANTDFTRVHVWLPVDSDLIPNFTRGNLVLVGDAAHPLLPFTSQGVSSAVADAIALAGALQDEGDLVKALSIYSALRHQHCSPYVAKGRELMQQFLQPLGSTMQVPIA